MINSFDAEEIMTPFLFQGTETIISKKFNVVWLENNLVEVNPISRMTEFELMNERVSNR